jgi:Flp pilus assembly protein TadD
MAGLTFSTCLIGTALAILCALPVVRADIGEQPVGLILNAGTGKLLRANTQTPLSARAGDLLFAGDGLRSDKSSVTYLFCPAKESQTLATDSEIRLEAKQSKIKIGKLDQQRPVASCYLPSAVRLATASQQHYGVTMTRGVNTDFPPIPRDQLDAAVLNDLRPYEDLLAKDPKDVSAIAGSAAVYESHQLQANSLAEYFKLRAIWPEAEWIKRKVFEQENALAVQAAAAAAAVTEGGNTYALLIGVSKYGKPELNLQYADRDATSLDAHLKTGRGGSVPSENILVLTNEKATTAAVRNGFEDFLKRRAGKNDTVFILVAGHGTSDGKNAYVLTYDSDPQDLKTTAISMADLQALFSEQLAKVGRVVLLVDVCKGNVGALKTDNVSTDIVHLGDVQGQLLGLVASRPRESSFEGPEFGGGHGAFSYYVLKGLVGGADANKDEVVDAAELVDYVTEQVKNATKGKQHPREFGNYENTSKLSDLKKPGIQVARPWRIMFDSRNGEPFYMAQQGGGVPPANPQVVADLTAFQTAIQNAQILPGQPNGAFELLPKLRAELGGETYFQRENELRVALEDRAQLTVLKYLAGDQNPQTQGDFNTAGLYMAAAQRLTQESIYLEGRKDFFSGRSLLFDQKYPEAANLLESAIRIDPTAAYGYNALGIAYLEQAQFAKAIPAFRDAANRAQHWSYPLHNLALSYMETGDYRAAVRTYQQAIKITPQYSYLPYNLGLVYQRLNRRKDAEKAYRQAMALAPTSPEPYNALGSLKATEGKTQEAERLYRDALQRNDALLPARHNLALLLASERGREPEAITLWNENLRRNADYLPSRISLAETQAASGNVTAAIEQYRQILQRKPEYIAARLALASNLAKTGDAAGALAEVTRASQQEPGNPQVLEALGDVQEQSGNHSGAATSYQKAIETTTDGSVKKRLRNKLRAVSGR